MKPLADYFDRVVCINLDRRPDRWEQFCEKIEEIDWPFLKPKRYRAVDGKQCPPPDWMRNRYLECEGAWGCYQSHLRILEDALLDDVDRLLILEDDVVFESNFGQGVDQFLRHVPAEWDQLYFGGEHMADPITLNSEVLRCVQVHRTHAYAFQKKFIRAAYDYLISYPTVDHYKRRRLRVNLKKVLRRPKSLLVSSHSERSAHVDHHFGQMHLNLPRFQVFSPHKWLVGQAAGHSNIMELETEEAFWRDGELLKFRAA